MPAAQTTPRDSTTAKAPQLRGWVEVFRAGTHTDAKGREFKASVEDLDQIVANQELGRAPAVLGHPKDNDPAYAWVDGLKRDGDRLFAKFADINPAFDDGVALGAYRNRSIKIVRDKARGLRLWHVGWLGAQPPAIDGLSPNPVQFSAADAVEEFEFGASDDAVMGLSWALDSVGSLMRGMRDHLIDRDGVEVADRLLPSWQIDSLMSQARSARDVLMQERQTAAFNHPANHPDGDPSMPTIQLTQEQLDEQLKQAREQAAREAEAQFSAQGKELAELRAERVRERHTGLINGWKAKGLVLPAEETGMREFMAALESSEAFEFSAADGSQPVKKTPIEWFAEFMAARQPLVKTGLVLPPVDDGQPLNLQDPADIERAAHAFMKSDAGAGYSFELAVQHVTTNTQAQA